MGRVLAFGGTEEAPAFGFADNVALFDKGVAAMGADYLDVGRLNGKGIGAFRGTEPAASTRGKNEVNLSAVFAGTRYEHNRISSVRDVCVSNGALGTETEFVNG
jgi:hypothetical protein